MRILFEQTEWITSCIYFLPANYRLPFAESTTSFSGNILPLFEFSYFKLDRSVNVESRLAPNFFDEYCYRNRSESWDRIEPFSFKVAQLTSLKNAHIDLYLYVEFIAFRTFIYATLKANSSISRFQCIKESAVDGKNFLLW